MTPASSASLAAFLAICLAIVAAYAWATRGRTAPLLGLAVWLGLFCGLVLSGFLQAQPMPRLIIGFTFVNLVSLAAALSPLGRQLAEDVPIAALVGFQAFRLPLELVLHDWAAGGTIPGTMTWTGQNWDIVTGICALALAPLARRSPSAAWIANLLGLVLLLNVFRVVILSSPLPFAWPVQPPLLLAFHLPYALIVPICVGGALFGHVVLTRALWRKATG